VITNLEGVIQPGKAEGDSGIAAAQVSALIRAGNELAGHRRCPSFSVLFWTLRSTP